MLTVLLAVSIFQTIIVIVVIKILEKYLFKKFSFRNEFSGTLCKYTPQEGRNAEKINCGAASMLQVEVFLKEGGARTFPIKFFQGLPFLHLEITLPFSRLCCAFEEKKFSATTIL